MKKTSFEQQVNINKAEEKLLRPNVIELATELSSLKIRERGCYITQASLHSISLGKAFEVLYSEADISKPKLNASHPMLPVGPNEGVGGQHGFPRWVDYEAFALEPGPGGQQRIALQAERPDDGLALTKGFELSESTLITISEVHNSGQEKENTSVGEHLYFSLQDGDISGLTLGGKSLDELLGEGSEELIKQGEPLFWKNFGINEAVRIKFSEGYEVDISSAVESETGDELGMLIWHRVGSESICFEPTLGFNPGTGGSGLSIAPHETVRLRTQISLL